ncbi:hypothetical protein RJ639_044566 [Escallonia herrerae]|uniref:RPW8 domain-containing protein n=1 Tax=Escallonia herrerae TaxID=1293975 RepID=A0AA88WE41_9ASTE|nr:hypothetical protein RJ639_044566 [Escallonia herrerae]
MAVTDFFAGEIATELLKMLFAISRKACLCKSTADELISSIQELLPIIQEIKYSGVELQATRQRQLDELSEMLRGGLELAGKVLNSGRWNVYKNLQLARRMEKLEKRVSRFLQGPMQAHVLADVHHMRFESAERFDRLEKQLGSMKIGVRPAIGEGVGWLDLEGTVKRVDEEARLEGSLVNLGAGMEFGKRKVKEMVIGRDTWGVVGICGIGGSGKTTLAREICRDAEVQSYFNNRILFETVSQSPDVEQLRLKIRRMVSGTSFNGGTDTVSQWSPECEWKYVARTLIVLDDVWSLTVLEQLLFRYPGCKILVVSRFKFPSVLNCTYELDLLREDEAMSLFCHSAFGMKSIPPGTNVKLVTQVVDECKRLPLALKVVGASLRDQPEMIWTSAKSRLSRGEPISESHEIQLLERMKLSIDCLPEKVRECFLDLGAFPEDKKIPLDVLINIWVEIHDIPEVEAFAILVELSNKNLLNLVKDARAGDMYSSYYDISVSQHDVLRDLALHLSNSADINQRRRLLMPRRETGIPKEWERNIDRPFNAQILSVHTGEMREMDWCSMDFPKAEVLILNFASSEFFLPPFIASMPKLRALILINYSTSNAVIHNLSAFTNLSNLRSLWFEKVVVPHLPETTVPLKNLRKISLVLCKMNNSLDGSVLDMPHLFPCLSELTMDHCINLNELPSSICRLYTLTSLSVTNCDSLLELPADVGRLSYLQILRIYACPNLKKLPPGIGKLLWLKYLDISQCVNLGCLPESIAGCSSLEKIDMRECPHIKNLPTSAVSLRSLRRVICDEQVSWQWKQIAKVIPDLHIQVAEECFNLDWLVE